SSLRASHQILLQNGTLDAGYLPSPTGDQWYINSVSVPGLIGELKQFDEQQRSRRQPAAPGSVTPEISKQGKSYTAGSSMLPPAAADFQDREGESDASQPQQAVSGYVLQLEKRIEEKYDVISLLKGQLKAKDEQITRHSERERETNLLIRGLQNLV